VSVPYPCGVQHTNTVESAPVLKYNLANEVQEPTGRKKKKVPTGERDAGTKIGLAVAVEEKAMLPDVHPWPVCLLRYCG
jgi:hypothetical protein